MAHVRPDQGTVPRFA